LRRIRTGRVAYVRKDTAAARAWCHLLPASSEEAEMALTILDPLTGSTVVIAMPDDETGSHG
jgi:hypothetical protein